MSGHDSTIVTNEPDLGKAQTDFIEVPPDALVLNGVLPSSYIEAGGTGRRVYQPADSRTANVSVLYLTQAEIQGFDRHSGVKYTIIVQPIPQWKQSKQ